MEGQGVRSVNSGDDGCDQSGWCPSGTAELQVSSAAPETGQIEPNFQREGVLEVVVQRATTIVEDNEAKMDVDDTLGNSRLAAIHASSV